MNSLPSHLVLGALTVALFSAPSVSAEELTIALGTELSWDTTTGNTYELQSAPSDTGPWTTIAGPTAGDGNPDSYYYDNSGAALHFQVLETVPGTDPSAQVLTWNGDFEAGTGDDTSDPSWSSFASGGTAISYPDTGGAGDNGGFGRVDNTAGAWGGGLVSPADFEVAGNDGIPLTYFGVAAGDTVTVTVDMINLAGTGIGGIKIESWGGGSILSNSGDLPASGQSSSWATYTWSYTIDGSADAIKLVPLITPPTYGGGNGQSSIGFDNVGIDSGEAAGPGTDEIVNTLPVDSTPVANGSWSSISGTTYQPEVSNDLSLWDDIGSPIDGDDTEKSFSRSISALSEFYRLGITVNPVLPPSGLRTTISGNETSVGLAWTASPTAGVTNYRVVYGTQSGNLDQSVDVGPVTSAIIANLTPDQPYFFAVIAVTGSGESPLDGTEITATPNVDPTIIPLFNGNTVLEPATSVETDTALYTYLADRVRARHARESQFNRYDIYLKFYWEQRILNLEIVDYVAKGGTDITFNYTTLRPLSAAEFRTFFGGVSTVAQYNSNQMATLVSSNPSAIPGETDYNYTATISQNYNEGNRPLENGDRVEIEISQFLLGVRNGQLNYYGTTLLYVVGQGIVPWGQANDLGIGNPGPNDIVGGVRLALDSYPIPETAWLGGLTTNHYQYSDEPKQSFKQMAGNISPTNGYEFLLGRRLHHTNFETGAHSEPENPIFTEHVGKLGPKYINNSCVDCHTDNGRSLPSPLSASILQSVVKVGSDATGTPHATLGSVLQPKATDSSAESSIAISSYTTTAGQYGDGTSYELRKPNYTFTGTTPQFYSVRGAPQLVGLGLLEAIDETTIADLADPTDQDQDGVSGRMSIVTDPVTNDPRLGRFTHKASVATVEHQIAAALNTDMGVTTSVQPILDGETTGGTPELSDVDLDYMTRYVALLGVNAQRNLLDADVILGEQLFASANCVACHIPSMETGPNHPRAELRNQTIRPFTDLLLHDMGAGLADNMGDGDASGSEWRTAPLWSIGLTAGVSGGEAYLHDGRARTLEEAILWHGGEAEDAKEAFRTMPASDRDALVAYLKSL